jgi:Fe-S-cluster containining protein
MTCPPNCGLCCTNLLVEASAFDVLREPRIEAERPLGKRSASLPVLEASWIVSAPGRPCAFLGPRCRCAIYPTRPAACVCFVAGSPRCEELRRGAGLPPLTGSIDNGVVWEIKRELCEEDEE